MDDHVNRCQRCILPESFPALTFDEQGICNKCRAYERRWSNFNFKKSEEYVRNIFEAAKGNKYDCVIGISGGKDSSYALYLCTQRDKLKPLCVTFDNGFLSTEASDNIRKLTTKLEVKHISFKPDWELMKRLYKHFLLTTGEFCSPCNIGIGSFLYDTANKYNIPLIISGFSPRTDADRDNNVYHITTEYFQNVARGYFSKNEIQDFLHSKAFTRALYHLTGRIKYITLPLYIEWDEEEMVSVLERQIDWKAEAPITTEHTDCIATKLKEYLRIKEFGFSEKTMKFSVLVRNGAISREEALARVEAFESEIMEDKSGLVRKVMQMLDLSEEELAEATTKRQRPFIPKFARLLEKDNLMKRLYYKY